MTQHEITEMTTEGLHGQIIDTVNLLNAQMQEIADRGCDVNVQVLGTDDNLQAPKSRPEIVVRVTQLVGYAARVSGEVKAFRPRVVEDTP